MAMYYQSAVAAAEKIFGKKLEVPEFPSPAVQKANDAVDKAFAQFDKTRQALENDILELQKAIAGQGLASKQFAEKLERSDLGADKNSPDYKKKRAEAQKNFKTFFDYSEKAIEFNIKCCDELDKHLMNISNYKSPKVLGK